MYYVGLLHGTNITPTTGIIATFVITGFQTVFICNVLYDQGLSPFKSHIPSSNGSFLIVIKLKPKENVRTAFIFILDYINPYPTAFPYGNGMVLHFYQQQESSTTKTVHKVINKGLKTYV